MSAPKSVWSRYGFFWVTLVLFLGSLAGHWVFAWYAKRYPMRDYYRTA